MDDKRKYERNIRKIRSFLYRNSLLRDITERLLRFAAKKSWIPADVKRALAQQIVDGLRTERESISDSGLRALHAFAHLGSIPVHLHRMSWEGVDYKIWEEMSKLDGGGTNYTVFLPDIRFPSFTNDPSIKEHETRARLDILVDNIWRGVLYEEPIFRDIASYKRPELRNVKDFREVPHKGTYPHRVPFFSVKSISDANTQARGIIHAHKKYEGPLTRLIEQLGKDPSIREEFFDDYVGNFEVAQLLKKYGLEIDILPKVIGVVDDTHQDISYRLYEVSGGSSGGENKRFFWGFIYGIQFPDFLDDPKLTEAERDISSQTLSDVIFENALYSEPYFLPEAGTITHLTPRLANSKLDEAKIVGIDKIPIGVVVPFVEKSDYDHAINSIRTTINAYERHRDSLHDITKKLGEDETLRRQIIKACGGSVSNNVDAVARLLGSHGASFVVENPYHLERARRLREFADSLPK